MATNKNGIRRTTRGLLCIAAMIVFASLAHMIVHVDLSEGIIGVIGGALVVAGTWVKTAFDYYFPPQGDDSPKGPKAKEE